MIDTVMLTKDNVPYVAEATGRSQFDLVKMLILNNRSLPWGIRIPIPIKDFWRSL